MIDPLPLTPPSSRPMLIADAALTARLLPHGPLVDALDAMRARARAGAVQAPERSGIALPRDGVLLLMPAADHEHACVKLVSVHPHNPAAQLPVIHGTVMLMRADTGQPLAVFDGPTLTARRTAAVSVMGARLLRPEGFGRVLIVGTGQQAGAHARALWATGRAHHIHVCGRDPVRTAALVQRLRDEGLAVDAVARPDGVLAQVQTVVTTTSSTAPVIGDGVAPGTLVIAIGAFKPDMVELPATLVQRSDMFVDTLAGAHTEAGDLIQAGIDWSRVRAIQDVREEPARSERPVVFKTVGHAMWDLAAAQLAWAQHAAA